MNTDTLMHRAARVVLRLRHHKILCESQLVLDKSHFSESAIKQ